MPSVCPPVACRSHDHARTFGDYVELETGHRCTVLSGVLPMQDGRVLLLLEVQAVEGDAAGKDEVQHELAMLSDRSGDFSGSPSPTVVAAGLAAARPSTIFWDQRQCLCPTTGRLAAAFWTYNRASEDDIDISFAWGEPDGDGDGEGILWEQPRPTGIAGQIAQPAVLRDGRVFLFYVHRSAPCSMRLVCSRDGGRTFPTDDELVVYATDAAHTEMQSRGDYSNFFDMDDGDMAKWTFGHPAVVVLDESTLLLAYYAGVDETQLDARWAVVTV